MKHLLPICIPKSAMLALWGTGASAFSVALAIVNYNKRPISVQTGYTG